MRSSDGHTFKIECPASIHHDVYEELQMKLDVPFSTSHMKAYVNCAPAALPDHMVFTLCQIAEFLDMQDRLRDLTAILAHRVRAQTMDYHGAPASEALREHMKLVFKT